MSRYGVPTTLWFPAVFTEDPTPSRQERENATQSWQINLCTLYPRSHLSEMISENLSKFSKDRELSWQAMKLEVKPD